eukprot:scaffold2383_cov161-Amphora_coffeaeformis.AAC.4
MEQLGTDFNATGSVMTPAQRQEQRRKRGECVTCGEKCFQKRLFKMVPITVHGKVLNGRCLNCRPLDTSEMSAGAAIPAVSRPTTEEDLQRFRLKQEQLNTASARSQSISSAMSASLSTTSAASSQNRPGLSSRAASAQVMTSSAAQVMIREPRPIEVFQCEPWGAPMRASLRILKLLISRCSRWWIPTEDPSGLRMNDVLVRFRNLRDCPIAACQSTPEVGGPPVAKVWMRPAVRDDMICKGDIQMQTAACITENQDEDVQTLILTICIEPRAVTIPTTATHVLATIRHPKN